MLVPSLWLGVSFLCNRPPNEFGGLCSPTVHCAAYRLQNERAGYDNQKDEQYKNGACRCSKTANCCHIPSPLSQCTSSAYVIMCGLEPYNDPDYKLSCKSYTRFGHRYDQPRLPLSWLGMPRRIRPNQRESYKKTMQIVTYFVDCL